MAVAAEVASQLPPHAVTVLLLSGHHGVGCQRVLPHGEAGKRCVYKSLRRLQFRCIQILKGEKKAS